MKKFLILLSVIFCGTVFADTITINWLNEDKTINQTTACTIGGDVILPNNIPQKRGYTFKGYVDNYTPVEYIESTGSQYIDTGYYANQNTGVKARLFIVHSGVHAGIFGGATYGLFVSSGHMYYAFKNNARFYVNPPYGQAVWDIAINKNACSINIDTNTYGVTATSNISFVDPETMCVFKKKDREYVCLYKLYYFQIYDDDVLVRDFIPVVDSKGVACLYDKIEHKFYYNAGSGEFIAGPAI